MTIIVKVELRVCLTHEYVEIMQFSHWKLGVRLIHERVFHTRRYGTVPCFWDALAQIRCDDTNSRAIQDTVVSVQFLSPGWKWGTTFQWVSLSFFFFFKKRAIFFGGASARARARVCVWTKDLSKILHKEGTGRFPTLGWYYPPAPPTTSVLVGPSPSPRKSPSNCQRITTGLLRRARLCQNMVHNGENLTFFQRQCQTQNLHVFENNL